MSESRPYRHTSGEWQKHPDYDFGLLTAYNPADGEKWQFCDVPLEASGKIIGMVSVKIGNGFGGFRHCDSIEEAKANLALMSAAPNLLESLTDLVEKIREAGWHREIVESAEAAIAKATTY